MNAEAYRNALMWAFDRLGVDGGMSEREQIHTMREIGKVLCGRPSPAATYKPNDWDSSAKLPSPKAPRFAKTFCSQCGGEFGPGDSGFSHCEHHAGKAGRS